jgi:Domain of unknown function (DUF4386)
MPNDAIWAMSNDAMMGATMTDLQQSIGEQVLLRVGAVAAVIGTVFQVAAGTSQSVQLGATTEAALSTLGEQPDWVWPVIYMAFIFGALLWMAALVALATTLTDGVAWALARLAVVTAIVGVTLHAVDGTLNAVVLEGLARTWAVAPSDERAALVQDGDLVRRMLDGTWASVITLYHGLPFVLAGLAVALSRRYPAWLGWIGVIGGAGSLLIGIAMLFGVQTQLAVPFAVVLSFFMVVLGWLLWEQASRRGTVPVA